MGNCVGQLPQVHELPPRPVSTCPGVRAPRNSVCSRQGDACSLRRHRTRPRGCRSNDQCDRARRPGCALQFGASASAAAAAQTAIGEAGVSRWPNCKNRRERRSETRLSRKAEPGVGVHNRGNTQVAVFRVRWRRGLSGQEREGAPPRLVLRQATQTSAALVASGRLCSYAVTIPRATVTGSSCSQNRSTRQPASVSVSVCCRSRAALPSSFGPQ